MLDWPPRIPGPPPVGPPPEPRFQVLRAIFHHAYLSLPPETWYLPLRQQSEAVLRRVIEIARSYTSPCKELDRLAQDPGEYAVLATMANLGADTGSFLRKLHAIHADDDFPAAIVDPDGRRGRSLS